MATDNELTNDEEYKWLAEEFDLRYMGDQGGPFIGSAHRAVWMTRTGDAYQRVNIVTTDFYAFMHENDWVGTSDWRAGRRNVQLDGRSLKSPRKEFDSRTSRKRKMNLQNCSW